VKDLLLRHRLFLSLLALKTLAPLLMLGSLPARVHDNLDSEVVYNTVIGRFWAGGADPEALDLFLSGTLAWTDFARVLQPLVLLYAVLPPMLAYAVNDLLMLGLAYAGFWHLLRVLELPDSALLACLMAFGMSYTVYGTGLAGAPLVIALALSPRAPGGRAVLAAAALGLNAALILHALFVPLAAGAVAAMLARRVNPGRAGAVLGVYVAASLAGSAGLILGQVLGLQSHRLDWVLDSPANLAMAWLGKLANNLLTLGSAYHAVLVPALHLPVILLVALRARGAVGERRAGWVLVAWIAAATGVDTAATQLSGLLPGSLATVQWGRALLLAPLLALVLAALVPTRAVRAVLGLSLGLAMLAGMGINGAALVGAIPPETTRTVRDSQAAGDRGLALRQAGTALARIGAGDILRGVQTWDRHFRPQTYACLGAAFAADPGARRVLSYGPDPMIAPFHGIPAADGYHNLYPLAYKRAFRAVIAPILATDPALASYYDNWGNRISTLAGRLPAQAVGTQPDWAAAAALGISHAITDRPLDHPALTLLADCAGFRLYRIEFSDPMLNID